MKKALLSTIVSFVTVMLITQDRLAASVVGFLMAGAIPGTTATVPFWIMLTVYCLAITAVITMFAETTFLNGYSMPRQADKKTRLPKRRYTTIT